MKSKTMTRITGFLVCLIAAVMVCAVPVSAVTYKLSVSDQALWEASEDLTTAAGELGLTNAGGVLTFEPEGFIEKTNKEQKAIVKNFMSAAVDAGISTDGTTTIMDALNANDKIEMSVFLVPYMFDEMRGDVIGGAKILSPWMSAINVIIGLGSIVILAMLLLHSVYDLLIIVVPVLRTKIASGGKEGDTKSRPAYVSEAAWSAIVAAETSISGDKGEYKSALWIYFKRRLPEYIVIVLIITVLLLGGFSSIIQALMSIGGTYTG